MGRNPQNPHSKPKIQSERQARRLFYNIPLSKYPVFMRILCVFATKLVPVFCLGKCRSPSPLILSPEERRSPMARLYFPVAGGLIPSRVFPNPLGTLKSSPGGEETGEGEGFRSKPINFV
jgi:hypothetical protein